MFNADNLADIFKTLKPEIVFFPTDVVPEALASNLFELSLRYKFAIKKLPKIMDALLAPRSLEKIDLSLLLNRDESRVVISDLVSFYQNKVVMVTGAGGSIGSELSVQISACNPKNLFC